VEKEKSLPEKPSPDGGIHQSINVVDNSKLRKVNPAYTSLKKNEIWIS
jgi:hypothetical protein